MLEVGDVFVWPEFPDGRDQASDIKPRWFVCLGRTGVMHTPVSIFLSTTTTQLHHYAKGGSRQHRIFLRIRAGQFGFTDDCVIDFSDAPYDYPADYLDSIPIQIIGRIGDQQFLRRLCTPYLGARIHNGRIPQTLYERRTFALHIMQAAPWCVVFGETHNDRRKPPLLWANQVRSGGIPWLDCLFFLRGVGSRT